MKRKKVKSIKQLGNTGTQLEKEVAAMEEAMKQHNIEENCQKLIDGLMPQIKDMERTLYGTYHRNIIEYSTSRIKTPESIVKKLKRNGYESTIDNMVKYINDIAGIRIICSFTSDIYQIADMISEQRDIKVIAVKDYITFPKASGYKSYHMIVTVPVYLSDRTVDTKVEIQIRTVAMDFWASLEHKIHYKFEGDAPEHIKSELVECAKMVADLDARMLSLNEEILAISREREEKEELAAKAGK